MPLEKFWQFPKLYRNALNLFVRYFEQSTGIEILLVQENQLECLLKTDVYIKPQPLTQC